MQKRNNEVLQSTRTDIPSSTSDTPKFNHDNTTDSDAEILKKRFIPKKRFTNIKGSPLKKSSPNKTNNSISSISSTNSTIQSQRSLPVRSKSTSRIAIPILDIKPPPKVIDGNIRTERPQRSVTPPNPSPRKVLVKRAPSTGRRTAPLRPVQVNTDRPPADLSVIPESEKVTDTSNRSGANDFFITGLLKKEESNTNKDQNLVPPNPSPEKKHKIPQNAFTFNNLENMIIAQNIPKSAQNNKDTENQPKPTPPESDGTPRRTNSGLPKVFPRAVSRGNSSRNISPDRPRVVTASQNKLTELSSEETTTDFKKVIRNKAEYLEELHFQFEKFKQEMANNPRAMINSKLQYIDTSKTSSAISLEKKTVDTSRSINRESYDFSDSANKLRRGHYRSKSIGNNIRKQNLIQDQKPLNVQEQSPQSKLPTTRVIIVKEPPSNKPKVPNFHFRRFSMGELKSAR